MRRRGKQQSGSVRAGPLVFALILSASFCGAGMGYVWHRNRNEQLSRQIRDLTVRLDQLNAASRVLDRQLEELRSPRALEAAVRKWNLGLVMPQPEQILRLPEDRPGASAAPLIMVRMAVRRP